MLLGRALHVAEKFNSYFHIAGSMESLGISENKLLLNPVMEQDLDVDRCIKKFDSHPSIISIKRHVKIEAVFDFAPITAEDIDKLNNKYSKQLDLQFHKK